MKIGILSPSIYMDEMRYHDRIFAPGPLVRALVTGLVKLGHDITWFTAPEKDARGATIVAGNQELLAKDLKFRVFQDMSPDLVKAMSLYGTKMYYELDLVERAYREAKEKGISLMHHFHSFGYFAHYFQEFTGLPTVYTLHDPMPTDDMLERWLLDRFPTQKFISISKNQQGTFGDHFIGTVYNGIDTSLFPFDAVGGDRFISVGRLIPEKGHDIAIVAAKKLGVGLTIASWESDSIKNSLYYQEKIEPFIDGKDIVINNLMRGENLAALYQKAKALVFPIQWEEPFGLVMIEAMSAGTPVIAFDRGSVSEVVENGVTGFVVPQELGVDGIVDAMKRIGEIDRAACRKRVEEKFTLEKMVEGYEKIYQKILSQ